MNFKFIIISYTLQCFEIQAAVTAASAQCALNELYYNSALSPKCEVNCQDLKHLCTLSSVRPVAGCYCKPNYARNLQQQCITQKECVNDCFRNEIRIAPEFEGCEKRCDIGWNICYRLEEKRCVCMRGYCRNNRGQCVINYI